VKLTCAFFVRRKDFGGDRRRFLRPVRREGNALQDFSSCRINHNYFVRQAGGHKQLAVRIQRQRQRSQAGEFDEGAGGRDQLIDRVSKPLALRPTVSVVASKFSNDAAACIAVRAKATSRQWMEIFNFTPA